MSDTLAVQNRGLLPPVRKRVRWGLHLLQQGVQVTHETGRHDKIEITISGSVAFTDEADLERFIRTQHRHGGSEWPNVLNAPRGGRGRPYVQLVAREAWLFSGRLRYDTVDQLGRRQVRLQLSINPTRFAAYARRFNPQQVSDLCGIPEHELLRRDPACKADLKKESFERWDNVLPSDAWITAATREWQELVALYLEAIVRLVTSDFNTRAAVISPQRLLQLELASPRAAVPLLHHAEVAWEFGVHDARLSYMRLEQALRAAAPSFITESRERVRQGRKVRSRWISIELRQGVTLTVYTKLSDRIRMEIGYSSKGEGRTIGQLVHTELQFRENMSFAQRFEHLRMDGARRLNRVLAQLPDFSGIEAANAMIDLSDVLAEITRLADRDASLIRRAVSQLIADGRISTNPRSSLGRICRGLEQMGAVRRVSLVERSSMHLFVLQGRSEAAFRQFGRRVQQLDQTPSAAAEGS